MKRLSDLGDQLEAFGSAVDFEIFRGDLVLALAYSENGQGGRPPFDPVMMFKILVIQAANNLSDERTEFLINDRLSFMRFLGLGLSDRVPDARTIWAVYAEVTKAEAIKTLFARFDAALRVAVISPCPGRLSTRALSLRRASATLRRRRRAIKEGRIPEDWKDKPAKLRQKDRDARWTVKFTRAKPKEDGSTPPLDLAIPVFGYQNHVSIDCGFGFVRKWAATDAAVYEGARLREGLLDKTNTASSSSLAHTAYRSLANEAFMEKHGFTSRVHRKKPKGRAMPGAIRAGRQCQIENPRACRACVRRTKGPNGSVHPHHRNRAGNHQDRHGQSRLQHQTARVSCVEGWPRSAPNAAADRKITSPMRRRPTKHHPNIAEIVQSAQHPELLEVSSLNEIGQDPYSCDSLDGSDYVETAYSIATDKRGARHIWLSYVRCSRRTVLGRRSAGRCLRLGIDMESLRQQSGELQSDADLKKLPHVVSRR